VPTAAVILGEAKDLAVLALTLSALMITSAAIHRTTHRKVLRSAQDDEKADSV